jgi:catechol 2,3-dioxygenase-like lactoylglutathione lyase family enzyme
MPAGITHLDHPVVAVRDMDEAHGVYERLGFIIPPRGSHLEWGTGNWCIMFPEDYLELRGIVDGSRYTHHLDTYLAEKGEGLMGVAFGTRDAAKSYETAKESGLKPTALKELTRRFERPEGEAFPKFRIVYLSEEDAPGLLTTVICGHLTPEIIRRPEWLDHPNGVRKVFSVTTVVEDPAATKQAYEKLLSPDAVKERDGGLRLELGNGAAIDVVSQASADKDGIAIQGASLPYIPAMALAVRDIGATKDVLNRNGVPFTEKGSAIRVGPEHTCGVFVDFAEAKDV